MVRVLFELTPNPAVESCSLSEGCDAAKEKKMHYMCVIHSQAFCFTFNEIFNRRKRSECDKDLL